MCSRGNQIQVCFGDSSYPGVVEHSLFFSWGRCPDLKFSRKARLLFIVLLKQEHFSKAWHITSLGREDGASHHIGPQKRLSAIFLDLH